MKVSIQKNKFYIFLLAIMSLLLASSLYAASPWQGHYEGTVTGKGIFPVFNVSSSWELTVDENGVADFKMENVPFVDKVSSKGTVTDDGDMYMEFHVSFVGNNILTGSYENGHFISKIEKSMQADFDWVLNEDGSVEGTWNFDKIPVYFYSWKGSGTIAGQKTYTPDQPSPWAGQYEGTLSGEGVPIYHTVSGDWTLIVTENGQVNYKLTGLPSNVHISMNGTITNDGLIYLEHNASYFFFSNNEEVTGEHLGNNSFNLIMDDKNFEADFNLALDDNGLITGTWDYKVKLLYGIIIDATGTIEGKKIETEEDNDPIPWVGNYKGTLEGSGFPFVSDVSGVWEVVVNDDGSVLFELAGMPFVNKVSATGKINSKGNGLLEMTVPFIGDSKVSITHKGNNEFSAEIDGKIKASFEYSLFEDGTVDGKWEFTRLPVFFVIWQGTGTMSGAKDTPSNEDFPWEGHYSGIVSGTGKPIVKKVSGNWDLYIDSQGNVDFEITGMPFINKVTASGTVSSEGDIELHMYVPGIGNNVLTGSYDGNGNFEASTDDKIKASFQWNLSPEGKTEGTWVFDRIPVLFIKWQGSGELSGAKVDDIEI